MGNVTLTVLGAVEGKVSPDLKVSSENKTILFGTIAMSGSYAANGDTLDLSDYLEDTPDVVLIGQTSHVLEFVPGATAANGKVKASAVSGDPGALVEIVAAVDLDAVSAPFIAIGTKQL